MEWEYKVKTFAFADDKLEESLNLMGNAGWELVNTYKTHAENPHIKMIFKRPKQ